MLTLWAAAAPPPSLTVTLYTADFTLLVFCFGFLEQRKNIDPCCFCCTNHNVYLRRILSLSSPNPLLLLLLLILFFFFLLKNRYPLFKQCDAQWANDEMGISGNGERATVCREGCAMSCVAMALAGHKLYVNNSDATPGSLNTWLKVTDNYHCKSRPS